MFQFSLHQLFQLYDRRESIAGHTSSNSKNRINTPEDPNAVSLELRQPLNKDAEKLEGPTLK